MIAARKTDAPPATPEAQAKLIIEAIKGRQDGWFWGEHIIAAAIRQAEDAALERAAGEFAEAMPEFRNACIAGLDLLDEPKARAAAKHLMEAFAELYEAVPDMIREFKSKD